MANFLVAQISANSAKVIKPMLSTSRVRPPAVVFVFRSFMNKFVYLLTLLKKALPYIISAFGASAVTATVSGCKVASLFTVAT